MNVIDKAVSSDTTLGQLLDGLVAAPEAPLVFLYEGGPVKSGYHVTEVKAGAFSALDCGANPEAWSEMFVQLWDIDEDGRGDMPAGKFSAIIRKVSDHVRLDPAAKLTFEVSDGSRPMALYCASSPRLGDGRFEVALAARPSSCKPRSLAGGAVAGRKPLLWAIDTRRRVLCVTSLRQRGNMPSFRSRPF